MNLSEHADVIAVLLEAKTKLESMGYSVLSPRVPPQSTTEPQVKMPYDVLVQVLEAITNQPPEAEGALRTVQLLAKVASERARGVYRPDPSDVATEAGPWADANPRVPVGFNLRMDQVLHAKAQYLLTKIPGMSQQKLYLLAVEEKIDALLKDHWKEGA